MLAMRDLGRSSLSASRRCLDSSQVSESSPCLGDPAGMGLGSACSSVWSYSSAEASTSSRKAGPHENRTSTRSFGQSIRQRRRAERIEPSPKSKRRWPSSDKGDSKDSERLAELQRRRDALSLREAEERIAASVRLNSNVAVGDLLTLQARARTDRALDGLTSTILTSIDAARRRQVAADFLNAKRASDENRPFDALKLTEQAFAAADKVDANLSRSAFVEGEAILGPIIARIGVIVIQLPGQFTLGSTQTYDTTLGPTLADHLRKQGYATRPSRGQAQVIWDRRAPFRVEFQIAETQGSLYLQSKSRVSAITASMSMIKGQEVLWQARVIGRTQEPLPDLAAFVASRLAVSDRRSPETERLLYENARGSLLEQVGARLNGLPPL